VTLASALGRVVRKILLPDPLRTLGESLVPVKLHRDVTAQLKLTITKEA